MEIAIITFYITLGSIIILTPTQNEDVIDFLKKTYSTEILKQYINSIETSTLSMNTKDQMARFITYYIYNKKTCDICYIKDISVRVHKCQICTYNICIKCMNKLQLPIKCPQCNNIIIFIEISNIVAFFAQENKHSKVIISCLCLSFICFVLLIVLYFFFSIIQI